MKIIAYQPGTKSYLVATSKGQGFVADLDTGRRHYEHAIASIAAHGDWREREHDDALLKQIMELEEPPKE
jgi:hypothetical protein